MKILKSFICLLGLSVFLFTCENDFEPPHEIIPQGGFVRWDAEVESLNFVFDFTKDGNPVFEAPITAPGDNVTAYDLSFTYVSKSGTAGPFNLLTLNTFPTTLKISAQEVADAAGVPLDDLKGTLNFEAAVTSTSGTTFTTEDFTGDLFNPGERQAMRFSLNTICPSDLAGTYNSSVTGQSTDGCCPNETTLEGTVTLTEIGTGTYTISDFSAGLYLEWYDVYGITAGTDVSATLVDACENIALPTFAEPFGSATSGAGTLDSQTGVIVFSWENGFGDTGTVTLTPQ